MSFNTSSYQLTVNVLTQTGVDGFWYVEKDLLSEAAGVGYISSGGVESAASIFGADDFYNILDVMTQQSIELKDIDTPINVDQILVENNIEDQVTGLTGPQIDDIVLDWNEDILIVRGAIPLLAMMLFRNGDITLTKLSSLVLDIGYSGKLKRDRLVEILDMMVANGDITTQQKDAFLLTWDNDPNIP